MSADDVASGVHQMLLAAKADCEMLLDKFSGADNVRFSSFCQFWKDMQFSHIFSGHKTYAAYRSFGEGLFRLIQRFFLPPSDFQTRVGALYLMYGLYFKQPAKQLFHISFSLSEWDDTLKFVDELKQEEHLDAVYVFFKLVTGGAFYFTAYSGEYGPGCLRAMDDLWSDRADDEEASHLEAFYSGTELDQLTTLHTKYQQLKLALEGPFSERVAPELDVVTDNIGVSLKRSCERILSLFKQSSSASCARKTRQMSPLKQETDDNANAEEDENGEGDIDEDEIGIIRQNLKHRAFTAKQHDNMYWKLSRSRHDKSMNEDFDLPPELEPNGTTDQPPSLHLEVEFEPMATSLQPTGESSAGTSSTSGLVDRGMLAPPRLTPQKQTSAASHGKRGVPSRHTNLQEAAIMFWKDPQEKDMFNETSSSLANAMISSTDHIGFSSSLPLLMEFDGSKQSSALPSSSELREKNWKEKKMERIPPVGKQVGRPSGTTSSSSSLSQKSQNGKKRNKHREKRKIFKELKKKLMQGVADDQVDGKVSWKGARKGGEDAETTSPPAGGSKKKTMKKEKEETPPAANMPSSTRGKSRKRTESGRHGRMEVESVPAKKKAKVTRSGGKPATVKAVNASVKRKEKEVSRERVKKQTRRSRNVSDRNSNFPDAVDDASQHELIIGL